MEDDLVSVHTSEISRLMFIELAARNFISSFKDLQSDGTRPPQVFMYAENQIAQSVINGALIEMKVALGRPSRYNPNGDLLIV